MNRPGDSETAAIFRHSRVAAGYADDRPYLHPEIFRLVAQMIGPGPRARPALDVGCGTGLSSVALLALADRVVGIDASLDMLRHATRAPGVRYVASAAETLPFRAGSFDLVVACGSMDWIDRERFMPRAAELIGGGGWLVSLDFGDTGRSPAIPGLARWYDQVFQKRYPRPPASDPMIAAREAALQGFGPPEIREFASEWRATAARYARFLMTESNVIAAVEYGDEPAGGALAWLEAELTPFFRDEERPVSFAGYVQALRRH